MMSAAIETMPEPLRAICAQVGCLQQENSSLDALRTVWQEHVARARRQVPEIHVEGEGESLHFGQLSPGCQACKAGVWDCIFVTMRCNLDCQFCYSPQAIPRDYAGSVFGSTPAQIDDHHARTRIEGISFSGGEPFTNAPGLFEWVAWFTSRHPDKYYWVYTNGLLADEEKLRRLGELGVDEIRFNLAATGYNQPAVMKNLAAAAGFIPNLTVEIPAIPEDTPKLLACLEEWCAAGVRYLNLHELMYEPGTHSAGMAGARRAIVTADGHHSQLNPASRAVTLAVIKWVRDAGLPLAVNDCSLQSKLRQLRGRRRSLAPLVQAPYEKLVRDEVYESCCAYDGEQVHFFHPDALADMRRQYPGYRFARLARTAPLSLADRGKWILFENL